MNSSKRSASEYYDKWKCSGCKKKFKRPFIRIDYQATEILNLKQHVNYLIQENNQLKYDIQKYAALI